VSGDIAGIGFLEGQFVGDGNIHRGWLTGWAGARPSAIRLSTGEVVRMAEGAGAATLLSVSGERLAVVLQEDDRSTVRTFRLPPDTRPTASAPRAMTAGRD
jgi:hypothetical protein